jgi:hypothetical protein
MVRFRVGVRARAKARVRVGIICDMVLSLSLSLLCNPSRELGLAIRDKAKGLGDMGYGLGIMVGGSVGVYFGPELE